MEWCVMSPVMVEWSPFQMLMRKENVYGSPKPDSSQIDDCKQILLTWNETLARPDLNHIQVK